MDIACKTSASAVTSSVVHGLHAVTEDQIEAVKAQRAEDVERGHRSRTMAALRRREPEYHHLHKDLDCSTPQKQVPVTAMADVDSRALLLNQLCLLFRVYSARARVQRRFDCLRKSQLRANEPLLSVDQEHHCGMNVVSTIPLLSIVETETEVLAAVEDNNNNTAADSNISCNFQSFRKRQSRVPFEFRAKHYTGERFPEFTVDISKEAEQEVSTFKEKEAHHSNVPDLTHYTQPLVTLETHAAPPQSYDIEPVPAFGSQFNEPDLLLSDQRVSHRSKAASSDETSGGMKALGSGLTLEHTLCTVPMKMHMPDPEDSLSGGSDSDDEGHHPFSKNLAWVPTLKTSGGKENNVSTQEQRPQTDLFDYFMYKYF